MQVSKKQSLQDRLSGRMSGNVDTIMPKIMGALAERTADVHQKPAAIDLATAENHMLRQELVELCRDAITEKLIPEAFSYPRGFGGAPSLLEATSSFLNSYFKPHLAVEPDHIVAAAGATACLDGLLFSLCDPDDAVLVAAPFWSGFNLHFRMRPSADIVAVNAGSVSNTLSRKILPLLRDALDKSPKRIRALVLTNPHNPFGQCYPLDVLEACVQFCQDRDIHFISDEVYALSCFDNNDKVDNGRPPFVSALHLDLDRLGVDRARVHVVWSTSKDFGSSGFRMGFVVTQDNSHLRLSLALLSSTQISSLTSIVTTALLTSAKLQSLIDLNRSRLSEAYGEVTSFLQRHRIQYVPATAGLYVFAKIVPDARTWEEEEGALKKLKEAGVLVSPGKTYHWVDGEKGWARITFAVERSALVEGLSRIKKALSLDVREGMRYKVPEPGQRRRSARKRKRSLSPGSDSHQ